jgi:hypothetical protein
MECRCVGLAAAVAKAAEWEARNTYAWVLALANARRRHAVQRQLLKGQDGLSGFLRAVERRRPESSRAHRCKV